MNSQSINKMFISIPATEPTTAPTTAPTTVPTTVSEVSITFFDEKTLIEFYRNIKNGIYALGSAEFNKQLRKNSLVMLYNKSTSKVVGVVKVAAPPVIRALIDSRPLYSDSKYNKYEISLSDVSMFREEMSYTEVLFSLGLPADTKTYMTHYQHLNKGGIRKFDIWGLEEEEKNKKIKMLFELMNMPFR